LIESGKYRNVVKVENFNLCGFFRGKTKTNAMMRLTMTAWKTVVPDLVHECPYSGEASGLFRMPRQLAVMIPSGSYRVKLSVNVLGNDQKQQTVFKFLVEEEVS
jgi:hypothetical protein